MHLHRIDTESDNSEMLNGTTVCQSDTNTFTTMIVIANLTQYGGSVHTYPNCLVFSNRLVEGFQPAWEGISGECGRLSTGVVPSACCYVCNTYLQNPGRAGNMIYTEASVYAIFYRLVLILLFGHTLCSQLATQYYHMLLERLCRHGNGMVEHIEGE